MSIGQVGRWTGGARGGWKRAALLCSLLLPASQAQAQPPADVRFSDERLTVHAQAVPLRALVERIGDLARVTIINGERLDGLASVDLAAQPVVEVLKTLLDRFNYIITRKPQADTEREPVYVLRVHSRVGGTSAARGPIRVPALEASYSDEVLTSAQVALLNDPHGEIDADEEAAEATTELTELEAAGEFAPTAPYTSLTAHLEHDNPLVRQRALVEINRRDPSRALPSLVTALGDDDLDVREAAVEILSRRSDAESLTPLGKLLARRDADPTARVAAFRVIAFRGHPASGDFVRRVTDDANPVIRAAASQFLEELSRRSAK